MKATTMPTPLAIRSVVLSVAMTATLALMGCSNWPMSNLATDKVDQLFATWNKPSSPGWRSLRFERVNREEGSGHASAPSPTCKTVRSDV